MAMCGCGIMNLRLEISSPALQPGRALESMGRVVSKEEAAEVGASGRVAALAPPASRGGRPPVCKPAVCRYHGGYCGHSSNGCACIPALLCRPGCSTSSCDRQCHGDIVDADNPSVLPAIDTVGCALPMKDASRGVLSVFSRRSAVPQP